MSKKARKSTTTELLQTQGQNMTSIDGASATLKAELSKCLAADASTRMMPLVIRNVLVISSKQTLPPVRCEAEGEGSKSSPARVLG